MITPTPRRPRRPAVTCGGRRRAGSRWIMRVLIPRRWCTGGGGSPGQHAPHRISDAVRKIVEETGVLKGRRRRAVDSTILADAVATQDTVTQLVAAIRRVGRV